MNRKVTETVEVNSSTKYLQETCPEGEEDGGMSGKNRELMKGKAGKTRGMGAVTATVDEQLVAIRPSPDPVEILTSAPARAPAIYP